MHTEGLNSNVNELQPALRTSASVITRASILIHDYAGHAFPTDLSRELARRGHQVFHAYASNLVTPRGPLVKRDDDPITLQFVELPMDQRYPALKYSFAKRRKLEINYGKTAAEFIRKIKPQIVLSGNTPTDSQIFLLRATHAYKGRFVSWVQDFYGIAVEKLLRKKFGLAGWPIGKYYRALDRNLLRRSNACIGITHDFENLLIKEGVHTSNIATIPNWAILRELPLRPKCNLWAAKHYLDDKFVYLYTGTMGMKHNPELIASLAQRMLSQKDVRVVVVSEGQGADWLKKEKASRGLANLQIYPYQPFECLPDLLATGDVLVAILEHEAGIFSVPSKVLSYLCAGRPTLLAVPAENLAARIVKSSGGGVVCEPNNIKNFTETAYMLYEKKLQTKHMGGNARCYAEENFQINQIADKFEYSLDLTSLSKEPSINLNQKIF